MNVETFLTSHGRPVLTVDLKDTVAEAALHFGDLIDGRKYSLAVVCDHDDKVVGVVSLGDIAYALGQHKEKAAGMPVRDIMTRDVATAHLRDDIMDLLSTMAQRDIRHMPVVEEGKLKGLVARRDALEFLADEEALELEHLRGFVFRSGARY
jgi:CBS domain-containing protein